MRSLLGALIVGLVLSLAIVFSVQWSLVRVTFDARIMDYIADELKVDADELFSSLNIMPGGAAELALAHYDPPFLSPYSGHYYQILVDGTTVLRSPSLAEESLQVVAADRGQRRVSQTDGPRGQALLLGTLGYELQGRSVTIAVARDLIRVRSELDRLMARYTQVSVIMFALLVVLQFGIVRFALAPLTRVRADVSRLERAEITQLSEAVPTEVLPLVREVNRLLAQLSRRLQRSREALGNLAHALKAPLTVLTHIGQDEYLRRNPELSRQMMQQTEALRSRIDAELRRARVAGERVAGISLDLRAEIGSLVATLRKLHRDRKLEIECRVDAGSRFRGDREDLLELCGNLVDNACKWASSRVLVSVRNDDGVALTVEDDGPGCSPQELDRIAQRGVRLDESTEGHGLGLAIATGIASSYGATIRFGRSQALGGFEVQVRFPSLQTSS